ncbi:MAG: pyrimidine operon attenuation protein/uracil phosphoribosyltransferase [Sphingobacteriales bacterium]|jgi:pyrimidine operon attenuation protein/uracil phosphoribosyltransferase
MEKLRILDQKQVQLKLERMAYQLAEILIDVDQVQLVGIKSGGYTLAQLLQTKIEAILDKKISLHTLALDKTSPTGKKAEISPSLQENKSSCIVLIDDVLESGRTMAYSLAQLLQQPWESVITTVLVDRQHTKFPLKADVVGMSLSTTLQENIEVVWDGSKAEVFLS